MICLRDTVANEFVQDAGPWFATQALAFDEVVLRHWSKPMWRKRLFATSVGVPSESFATSHFESWAMQLDDFSTYLEGVAQAWVLDCAGGDYDCDMSMLDVGLTHTIRHC